MEFFDPLKLKDKTEDVKDDFLCQWVESGNQTGSFPPYLIGKRSQKYYQFLLIAEESKAALLNNKIKTIIIIIIA